MECIIFSSNENWHARANVYFFLGIYLEYFAIFQGRQVVLYILLWMLGVGT